ncbi:MAG: hypothetical protein JW929_11640 [Anaerolineales bacterium]|nr:hypothetical protein [Anaerolineales bacterium]
MLERICLQLPERHPDFHGRLLNFLAPLGKSAERRLDLPASDTSFFPLLSIEFTAPAETVRAVFSLSGVRRSVPIENITGAEKKNPRPYRHISVEGVSQRLSERGWKILQADHIGFNLPWFGPDLHPGIRELREALRGECLYHRYPSGAPWDFILPGNPEETAGCAPIDYSILRRPKFELVSFDVASIPLLQIDLCLNAPFGDFRRLFPEALSDSAFSNIWLYLKKPYGVDICLVINEEFSGDWSRVFKGCRL